MAGLLGASFVPSEENAGLSRQVAEQEPISEAIKILSLRLPKFGGAQSMSPGALMQPHITGYRGPDPIVAAAIQKAMGGVNPLGGGELTGPYTPPIITPGQGPDAPQYGGAPELPQAPAASPFARREPSPQAPWAKQRQF